MVRAWSDPDVVDGVLATRTVLRGFRPGDAITVKTSDIMDSTILARTDARRAMLSGSIWIRFTELEIAWINAPDGTAQHGIAAAAECLTLARCLIPHASSTALSMAGERQFNPEYPGRVTVGPYMPLPPVQLLHLLGLRALGLSMVAGVGLCVAARAMPGNKVRVVLRASSVSFGENGGGRRVSGRGVGSGWCGRRRR